MNMLQWMLTPQPCVFYYYYFPAAMFLGMAIPVALSRLPVRYFGVRLSVACLLPAFCIFVYCFAHMAHFAWVDRVSGTVLIVSGTGLLASVALNAAGVPL